jgi:peptide/nickel transport system ATP-binding protein
METAHPSEALLEVRDLRVTFRGQEDVEAVRGASWSVYPGQTLGLVGESGSGKTASAFAVLGLHDIRTHVEGSIRFRGEELVGASQRRMQQLRGGDIGVIFQDALDSLNPFRQVGEQIAEAARLHHPMSKSAARQRAIEMLDRVGIREPHRRANDYPHQFSGGMRQRVMIAAALVNEPSVLLADEPTTALDSTVQSQVLDLLAELQRDMGMAVVFVTHDFGVVQHICTDVTVMFRGRVVESDTVENVLYRAQHPYTRALISSVPTLDDEPGTRLNTVSDVVRTLGAPTDPEELANPDLRIAGDVDARLGRTPARRPSTSPQTGSDAALLDVQNLSVEYHGRSKQKTAAVSDVSFQIRPGESFGLVGESGSGKSTISRVVAGLLPASQGTVTISGTEIKSKTLADRRSLARHVQMIFQDPYGSFNPDLTIGQSVGAPLLARRFDPQFRVTKSEIRARVRSMLSEVGLSPDYAQAYPGDLSGGMRQRAGIARALICEPELLIADEPVSALDVSVQAQVLNLLADLQERRGLALLFISHDLTVVRHICTRIAVLQQGRIVETGSRDDVMTAPREEYTKHLLSAAHSLNRQAV